jgi:hypothetical protein
LSGTTTFGAPSSATAAKLAIQAKSLIGTTEAIRCQRSYASNSGASGITITGGVTGSKGGISITVSITDQSGKVQEERQRGCSMPSPSPFKRAGQV